MGPLIPPDCPNRDTPLEAFRASLRAREQSQRLAGEFAILALKSLTLVSGGSIIAVLTFLGHLWAEAAGAAGLLTAAMSGALAWFVASLCLSLLAAVLAYISQHLHVATLDAKSVLDSPGRGFREGSKAKKWRIAATAAGLAAFGLYSAGAFAATSGLLAATDESVRPSPARASSGDPGPVDEQTGS